MNMLRYTFCLIWLLAVIDQNAAAELPAPVSAPNSTEYTITVVPFYTPEKIWSLYSPFIDFLKETTGMPWELKFYPNHDSLIDGLCSGKVSLALLGPVPLGRVIEKCSAEVLAVALGKDAKPFYHSVVVTSDQNILSLGDLKGKKFALFKGSTASHILPRKMLRDAGLQKSDLTLLFYESQDSIMNALLSHEVDAAGVKESLYKKFEKASIKVLRQSEVLPNFAFAAAPTLSNPTKKLFTEALFHLSPQTNEKDKQRVQAWDDEIKNGFIKPPPDFSASVQKILLISNEIMREDR